VITQTNVLDCILDWRPPTGITVASVEEPAVHLGDTTVVLLDTIGNSRQTVRLDAWSTPLAVERLLGEAANQMLGRKPASTSKRKKAI
jgi:hypothetical protein